MPIKTLIAAKVNDANNQPSKFVKLRWRKTFAFWFKRQRARISIHIDDNEWSLHSTFLYYYRHAVVFAQQWN